MKNDYESLNNVLFNTIKSAPDIYKYYTLFSGEDSQCILRHDDYGFFYIPKSVNELLNRYAEKYEIDFKELVLFFRIGYLEGKIHFQEKMSYELATYQFDGVKNYLLNIITGGNHGNYFHCPKSDDGIPNKIHTNRLQEMGHNNGEYYEAWRALVERHWLFNDFFREINIKEYKKNSNNPYSQMFPKRYFQYSGVPDSLQCAFDLRGNCNTLIKGLKDKIIPFKNEKGYYMYEKGKIQNLYPIIKPENTRQFYQLCSDFLKEAANNYEKGLVEINKNYYKTIIHEAEECIEILQDPIFRNCDMSSFDGFVNKGNWFNNIFDHLEYTVDSFKKKYGFLFNLEAIESQTDSEVSMQKGDTVNTMLKAIKDGSEQNEISIKDYLIGNDVEKEHLINLLKKDLRGKKGKPTAIVICALEATSLIGYYENNELFSALVKDLEIEGTQSGFNKYLTPAIRTNDFHIKNVSLYKEKIKKHMENIPFMVV